MGISRTFRAPLSSASALTQQTTAAEQARPVDAVSRGSSRHALRRLGSHYGMVRSDVRLHVSAALHMASANGHANVVSVLIAAGAVTILLHSQMPDLAALTFPLPPTLRPNDLHAPSSSCVCRICARGTRRETLRFIGHVSMGISRQAVIDRERNEHAHASRFKPHCPTQQAHHRQVVRLLMEAGADASVLNRCDRLLVMQPLDALWCCGCCDQATRCMQARTDAGGRRIVDATKRHGDVEPDRVLPA